MLIEERPKDEGKNIWVRSLLESHDASHNVAAVVLLPGSCLLRRCVDKHVHLVFPDLLGREALAHRPTKDSPEHFGGFLPSLEAAYRVGNKVVSDSRI